MEANSEPLAEEVESAIPEPAAKKQKVESEDEEEPAAEEKEARETSEAPAEDGGESADGDASSANKNTFRPLEVLEEGPGGKITVCPESMITFPMKLRALLDNEEFSDVIFWLPGGDAFCISPIPFSERVLEKHFQGTKFESFTRKLNRWGFRKAIGQVIPPDAISFQHEQFKKDSPELVRTMISGKKGKNASTPPRKGKQAMDQASPSLSMSASAPVSNNALGLAQQQFSEEAIIQAQLSANARRIQLLQQMQAQAARLPMTGPTAGGRGGMMGQPHPSALWNSLSTGLPGLGLFPAQASLQQQQRQPTDLDRELLRLYMLEEEQRKRQNQKGNS